MDKNIYQNKNWIVSRSWLLKQLAPLKGPKLSILISYHLFRASGIWPTVRDLADSTGLGKAGVSKYYREMVKAGYLEQPICAVCDKRTTISLLHRHHVKPRRDGGDESETNFLNVCKSCHNKIEPRKRIDKVLKAKNILGLFEKEAGIKMPARITRPLAKFLANRLY